MGRDWLLIDVLGPEPAVVAQGHQLRKFVPLSVFLRRNQHIAPIAAAIARAAALEPDSRHSNASAETVILAEPVIMNDGCVHGVHIWTGPPATQPRPRPSPGAVVWDLTAGTASSSLQALSNSGLNVELERTDGRPFAADLPIGDVNGEESMVLALSMSCKPGDTFSSTWDVVSHDGTPIRVSFVVRAAIERVSDGSSHLVCRAMNWRVPRPDAESPNDNLAGQILRGMAQEGIYRALVDLRTWNLLKWIDAPCPHIDWRGERSEQPLVHPDDRPLLRSMTQQFAHGPVAELLRLRAERGAWVLLHTTIYRVELQGGQFAGLICLRLPTPAELSRKSHNA